MRSSTDASPPPWPMRILRPWLVASAAGLSLGTLLLEISPKPQPEENSYTESAPRAAVYDPRGETIPSVDPFAPAPAPAETPASAVVPASRASDAAAPVSVSAPAGQTPIAP